MAGDLTTRLTGRLQERGAPCPAEAIERFAAYIWLLTKWNEAVNLTSLTLKPLSDETIDRLIVEPVLAAALIKSWIDGAGGGDKNASRKPHLLDIGSGGGSPAVPLKIVNPALRLTMVESRVRKSAFLREVIRQLDLSDADVLTQRIEAAASNPAVAGSVQLVSVRAVRLDASMWRTIDSLVSQDGGVLWFRTADESIEPSEAFRAESVLKTGTRHQVALLLRAHS